MSSVDLWVRFSSHTHTQTHTHTHTGDLIRKKEDHNRLELDCHMSLQRWDEALVVLTDLLHQNPDQWSDIKHYISCQIQKYKKSIQDAKEDHVREIEKRRMSGEGGGGEGGEEGERGKEEVWEGKGEKEEDKDGVGEMGTEKTNQLNTADSGYNGKIPQLVIWSILCRLRCPGLIIGTAKVSR